MSKATTGFFSRLHLLITLIAVGVCLYYVCPLLSYTPMVADEEGNIKGDATLATAEHLDAVKAVFDFYGETTVRTANTVLIPPKLWFNRTLLQHYTQQARLKGATDTTKKILDYINEKL